MPIEKAQKERERERKRERKREREREKEKERERERERQRERIRWPHRCVAGSKTPRDEAMKRGPVPSPLWQRCTWHQWTDARERGNVPLTDVDKHCDRIARKATGHGPQLERERNRHEEAGDRGVWHYWCKKSIVFFRRREVWIPLYYRRSAMEENLVFLSLGRTTFWTSRNETNCKDSIAFNPGDSRLRVQSFIKIAAKNRTEEEIWEYAAVLIIVHYLPAGSRDCVRVARINIIELLVEKKIPFHQRIFRFTGWKGNDQRKRDDVQNRKENVFQSRW